jgi:hypothetical protein
MYTDEVRANSSAPPTAANVSAKAEEKRVRRSRRLAPKEETNAPQEFLELGPTSKDKSKLRRKEKRRAQKLHKKQSGTSVSNQVNGGKA